MRKYDRADIVIFLVLSTLIHTVCISFFFLLISAKYHKRHMPCVSSFPEHVCSPLKKSAHFRHAEWVRLTFDQGFSHQKRHRCSSLPDLKALLFQSQTASDSNVKHFQTHLQHSVHMSVCLCMCMCVSVSECVCERDKRLGSSLLAPDSTTLSQLWGSRR